jgi:hypothetical protein
MMPLPAHAGPLGAMITKAVTTSELGVSVRQSVVRGAQLMDQLDGQWEQFSDTHGLGTERSKQADRPSTKSIPPLKSLDTKIAKELLQTCDEVFAEVTGISSSQLQRKLENMKEKVQPSFQRSAVGSLAGDLVSAEQLNYLSYAHFRTYADMLLEYKTDFVPFRKAFEQKMGERLCNLLTIVKSEDTGLSKKAMVANRLYALDQMKEILVEKGLVAQVDQSPLPSDRMEDWADDLAELSFSVALDVDATLGAQLLLEEQGFRLLPCYGRYMMLHILQMNGQKVTIDPYYFDTNYNSNPALFEVKEVLLNVVMESTV